MKCRADLADSFPCLALLVPAGCQVLLARQVIPPLLWPNVIALLRRGARLLFVRQDRATVRHRGPGVIVNYSVVVLATYGLTASTASSVDGRCRDLTVTHSPGFTALI